MVGMVPDPMNARSERGGMAGSSWEGRDAQTLCRERHSAAAENASEGVADDVTGVAASLCPAVLTAGQLAPLAKMIAWDLVHAGDAKG